MKYTKAMIEVIDLTAEDVVLTSGGGTPCQTDNPCPQNCPVDTERF